jgi:hypothetical protein
MTVSDILEETKHWPPAQVDALVSALQVKVVPGQNGDQTNRNAGEAVRKFQKEIDAIWAGTNFKVSNEDIVSLIRESRGRG